MKPLCCPSFLVALTLAPLTAAQAAPCPPPHPVGKDCRLEYVPGPAPFPPVCQPFFAGAGCPVPTADYPDGPEGNIHLSFQLITTAGANSVSYCAAGQDCVQETSCELTPTPASTKTCPRTSKNGTRLVVTLLKGPAVVTNLAAAWNTTDSTSFYVSRAGRCDAAVPATGALLDPPKVRSIALAGASALAYNSRPGPTAPYGPTTFAMNVDGPHRIVLAADELLCHVGLVAIGSVSAQRLP